MHIVCARSFPFNTPTKTCSAATWRKLTGAAPILQDVHEDVGCTIQYALLLVNANAQLVDEFNRVALQWSAAEVKGPTAASPVALQWSAAEVKGPTTVEPAPAAQLDADEPAESPGEDLPFEIFTSAERGELQPVVKWLRAGGPVDALCPVRGRKALLHAAAAGGHLEIVRELLERGVSVDLPSSTGFTALMLAALEGHAACVQVLLLAKANTELLDGNGRTALQHAERRVQSLFENSRHTATAALIRKQVCLSDYPAVVCSLWAGLHAHMMKISIAAGVLTPLIRVIAFTILSNLPEIRRVRGLVGRLVGRLVRRLVRWRLAYWLSLGLCLGLASESGF